MNIPKPPKKPLKHASPPSEMETVRVVVMVDYNTKELVLVSEDYRNSVNAEKNVVQFELDNLDNFGEGIKYSDVLRFKALLPPEIEDFEIEEMVNNDGYYEYTYLVYQRKKKLEQYQVECAIYNTRFETYDKARKRYEEKMLEYESWKKEQKKAKLEEQLKKLKE